MGFFFLLVCFHFRDFKPYLDCPRKKTQIIAVAQKNNDKPKILKENNAKRKRLIGKEDIDKDNPL